LLYLVGGFGFWEHCYVWKKYILVLGDFGCSILLCNLGTLFHQHPNPSSCKWTHRGSDADIHGTFLYSYSWCRVVGSGFWEIYSPSELGSIYKWNPYFGCCFVTYGIVCCYTTVTFNVQNVYKVVQSRKGSMLNALAMLFPFCVLLGVIISWDYMSPSDLIGNYPHMVVMGTGLAFGFLVGRMILAHLCDEPKGLKTGMSTVSFILTPLNIPFCNH
ncbi:choline/ethanolaminephosphotransferase 1-like, partial [Bidens hawaiensis]|uniref:choline/ethanolaminephosphotransferase 1-like n=1 Tax=Bidens hawaiensis TaxID=980011 RepID=UPI00404B7D1D